MKTFSELTIGQNFTNGTSNTEWVVISKNFAKNTENNKTMRFMLDTCVYLVETKLTKLEQEVLNIITDGDEFNESPTECFKGIMDSFSGTRQQLKGVLSSLFKK